MNIRGKICEYMNSAHPVTPMSGLFIAVVVVLAMAWMRPVLAAQDDVANRSVAENSVAGFGLGSLVTVDNVDLNSVHGKGLQWQSPRPTVEFAVILWDEHKHRTQEAGYSATSTSTGSGNVQRQQLLLIR